MGTKRDSGFTIIEVILFFAVSAALLVGIVAATGGAVGNARFTDSLKGIESFTQRQYEEVLSGVNTRSTSIVCGSSASTTPGASSCLLLGKIIMFTQNSSQVKTYFITGTTPLIPPANNLNVNQIISLYIPQVISTGGESYELPWGAMFNSGKRADNNSIDSIAYVRSPTSSQIEVYLFRGIPRDGNGDITTAGLTGALTSYATTTQSSATFCINAASALPGQYQGGLQLTQGQGASTISSTLLDGPQWTASC